MSTSRSPSPNELAQAVLAGDRGALARAITLVESVHRSDRAKAESLLDELMPHTGGAIRVGITGSPGVGKSTLIEALGTHLVESGVRVAVLAVDPSSSVSGGSILGDKSRMTRLASDTRAFVRPSPSARSLGGVAQRTQESLLLCEAAGYDVVLVETVGVGQSETVVADMVDFFLLMVLPGGGDELQGIKRGIVELADLIVVNKADGAFVPAAREAAKHYTAALGYLTPRRSSWTPRVEMISALTGDGVPELWDTIREHRERLEASGELESFRKGQRAEWFWTQLQTRLVNAFIAHPDVATRLEELERAAVTGRTTPGRATDELLRAFGIEEEDDGDA